MNPCEIFQVSYKLPGLRSIDNRITVVEIPTHISHLANKPWKKALQCWCAPNSLEGVFIIGLWSSWNVFPFASCCVWVEKYLLSGTMGRCKICWPWYVDYWRDSSPASGLNTFISSGVREWWWSAHTPSSPILLCSFARKQALRKVSHQKAQYNSFQSGCCIFSV